MYFPYLYAKRYEQKAVLGAADVILETGKVVPILEPVSSATSEFRNNMNRMQDLNLSFIVIVNPMVGDLKREHGEVRECIGAHVQASGPGMIGINVDRTLEETELETIVAAYKDHNICLIHQTSHPNPSILSKIRPVWNIFIDGKTGLSYQRHFQDGSRAIVSDGFNKQARNSDYAEVTNEFFGDLYQSYEDLGYQGFGDYTTVGSTFVEGGFTPHAVTIHLTYPKDGQVWIYHAVSNETVGTANVNGKVLQAAEKVAEFTTGADAIVRDSSGAQSLVEIAESQVAPQLGELKQFSIQNHIEMMARLFAD